MLVARSIFLLLAVATNSYVHASVDFLVTSDRNNPDDTTHHFVARIENEYVIAQARAELEKTEGFSIMAGAIEKSEAEWNPGWSFHFHPQKILFGGTFMNSCDATAPYIEEHLDEAGGDFLPNLLWCPWSARVLKELDGDSSPTTLPPPVPEIPPTTTTQPPPVSESPPTTTTQAPPVPESPPTTTSPPPPVPETPPVTTTLPPPDLPDEGLESPIEPEEEDPSELDPIACLLSVMEVLGSL